MPNPIISRLRHERTPLIDQNTVTFVWRGRNAPELIGDFTGWGDGNAVTLEKSSRGLWTYQLTLPWNAYIEYGFLQGEESISDPFNPRRTPNGEGGYNNFFSMPDYKPTELIKNDRRVAHGKIRQYKIPVDYLLVGNERIVHLYQPPVDEQVPLVVVWDGQEYLKRARLNYIVDNLIAQHRMRPIALALVSNGGELSRTSEYACNDATLAFLMTEVLPLAESKLNIIDIKAHSGEFGVMGASMGGLMAMYTGARLPHIFGKVFSQSGAFTLSGLDTVVFDLLDRGVMHPLKIWMDVGIYDLPGLLESNRRMQDVILERGHLLTFQEYNAGHNYPAWRDEIWRGLETLFAVSD